MVNSAKGVHVQPLSAGTIFDIIIDLTLYAVEGDIGNRGAVKSIVKCTVVYDIKRHTVRGSEVSRFGRNIAFSALFTKEVPILKGILISKAMEAGGYFKAIRE